MRAEKQIEFYTDHRPYERCLAYQARQAYQRAEKQGWLDRKAPLPSFLDPGMNVATPVEKVTHWLEVCFALTFRIWYANAAAQSFADHV